MWLFFSGNLSGQYGNLLLCGFMGAGKTCFLRKLEQTGPGGVDYLDLDGVILERSGYKTIASMMEELGEAHFRSIENEILLDLMLGENKIIALGGGSLNEKLIQAIERRGGVLVIWLDTPLGQCLKHIEQEQGGKIPVPCLIWRGGR